MVEHTVGWIAQSTHSTAVVGAWVFALAEEAGRGGLAERAKGWMSPCRNRIGRTDSVESLGII